MINNTLLFIFPKKKKKKVIAKQRIKEKTVYVSNVALLFLFSKKNVFTYRYQMLLF